MLLPLLHDHVLTIRNNIVNNTTHDDYVFTPTDSLSDVRLDSIHLSYGRSCFEKMIPCIYNPCGTQCERQTSCHVSVFKGPRLYPVDLLSIIHFGLNWHEAF